MSPQDTKEGGGLEIKEGGEIAKPEKSSEVQEKAAEVLAGALTEAATAGERSGDVSKSFEELKKIVDRKKRLKDELTLEGTNELSLLAEIAESVGKKAGFKPGDNVRFKISEGKEETGRIETFSLAEGKNDVSDVEALVDHEKGSSFVKLSDLRLASPEEVKDYRKAMKF